MDFKIITEDKNSNARAGVITTAHGKIQTPIFMPVGTAGSVKGIHQNTLENDINAQIILGNTYHLYLRPGTEVLEKAGGLHKFMSWKKPILTDSGGYQVFSLAKCRKLTNEGAKFQSHIDGSTHLFTPENVIDIQRVIGSDIMMALDECTPYPCDYNYAKKSLQLTNLWLNRGMKHYKHTEPKYENSQAYFPIVQGSVFADLRKKSAGKIAKLNCDGNAIGGLSVGEPVEMMYEMLAIVNSILPKQKPRYLMGVGTPANILEGIALGTDMFDCVMPTRNGRNGMLFTSNGIINIKNEKWKLNFSQIDDNANSFVDKLYTKSYLRHLFISGEMLGPQIASIHNLSFYLWLVNEARNKIKEGCFTDWKKQMLKKVSHRI